jgi:hypothetical protein
VKRHLNILTVLVFLIVLASLFAKMKGLPVPGVHMFGFSSGG